MAETIRQKGHKPLTYGRRCALCRHEALSNMETIFSQKKKNATDMPTKENMENTAPFLAKK